MALSRSAERDAAQLEATLAGHLQARLGYAVATFLRTPPELAAIAAYVPFTDPGLDAGTATLPIIFLAKVPPVALHDQLRACETPMDALHVHGREIYWLWQGKTMESLIDWPRVGKALALPPLTVRNATTIRKLAAKYAAAP
ncbi:MAG: DUF1697 domain-containing protein [Chloroflexales bacterium]|nr:DUF1697 domain-containing protein [Chloroflexales bacterium]